jgi:hypothetical protein
LIHRNFFTLLNFHVMKRFQYRLLFFAFTLVNISQTIAQEFRILDLKLKDICYSPVNDRIYGAVPGSLVQGNSIAVINPNTGVVEQSIPIGSEPTLVRVSNNGRYLFVGLYGSPVIQRYDLLTNNLDPAIDLELFVPPPYDTHYPIFTGDIQPIPQSANSIIASRNDLNTTPGFSGITAYDDTTARALKIDAGVIGGEQIVVTETGQTLWGLGHTYAPTAFQRYQVTAQGVVAQSDYPGLIANEVKHVAYQNGRIYLQNGQIFDVFGAGTPNLLTTVYNGQDYGLVRAPMVPALDSSVFYVLTDFNAADPFNFNGYKLKVYNKVDFSLKGIYSLPNDFRDPPQKMLSLGLGRIAVLAAGSGFEKTKLILFNSKSCIPQNLGLTVTPAVAFPCVGDTLTLNAQAGYSNYFWSNGATGQSIKVTSSDSLRYRVLGPNGCLSQFSPATPVLFEARPTDLLLQLDNFKSILCPDESTRIFPYAGSGNAMAYVFNTGDTILPTQALSVSEGGVYTAYAISAHGCASVPESVEIFEAIDNPGPPPGITANGPIVTCGNELVTLSAPPGALGYLWSNGATTQTLTPPWSASYAVQTIFENGCHSEWSDTLEVVIGFSPGQLQIAESFFVLEVTNPNAIGDSIQWYRNGQAIPGANNLSFTPTQLGIYTVQNFLQGCSSLPSLPYAFAGTCQANIIAQPNASPVTAYYLIPDPSPENTYTYLWSTGSTADFITVTTLGEYCLTVTRPADGATATDCITVVPNDRLRAGAVYNFQPIEGMEITLLKNNAGQYTTQDMQLTDATGEVLFENVPSGYYILQAVPPVGSPLELQYLPTYFLNSLFWNGANNVFNGGGLAIADELPTNYSIQLQPTQMFSGSGSVSGLIQESSGLQGPPQGENIEEPLEGVGVFLFNANGTPIAHVFTDANGNYYFGNLPNGTYTIYIDLPGTTPFSAIIVISAVNPNPMGVVFTLKNGGFSVGTEELLSNSIRIWPNPTADRLFIDLPEAAALFLYNALGARVGDWELSAGHSSILLDPLPTGVYWLKGQAKGRRIWQQRVVKQ